MQLMRLGTAGAERPFVRDNEGVLRSLASLTADIDGAFLAADGIARTRAALVADELPAEPEAEQLRIGAPIARPMAVVCVGMNYAAHAAESGSLPPERPVIFFKHPNTVVGPDDDVLLPPDSQRDTRTGTSVALESGRAYLGAIYASEVYSFVKTGAAWLKEATITHGPREGERMFGCSLALEGNTLVVGSLRSFMNSGGEAWVFTGEIDSPHACDVLCRSRPAASRSAQGNSPAYSGSAADLRHCLTAHLIASCARGRRPTARAAAPCRSRSRRCTPGW